MKLFQKIFNIFLFIFVLTVFLDLSAVTYYSVDWHPSGNYFAAGAADGTTNDILYIYSYNTNTNSFTLTDSRRTAANYVVRKVQWSPNGNYLAAGVYQNSPTAQFRIYPFNGSRIPGSPLVTQSYVGADNAYPDAIAWHPSGSYIALGGGSGGTPATPYALKIYAFNGTTLIQRDSKTLINAIRDVKWDSTGTYLITGGNAAAGTSNVYTYSFANSKLSASAISSKDFGSGSIIYSTSLSPDNQFALFGGRDVTGGNELMVYSFNNGVLSASSLDSRNYGTYVLSAMFHPNQQYVALGGSTSDVGHEECEIYGFDSQKKIFTTIPIVYLAQTDTVRSVDWSVDGRFILIGGNTDILRTYRSYYKGLGLYAYDGRTYNIYKDTNKILKDGENAIGWVGFRGGVTIPTGAGAKLNIELPLFSGLDLRTTCSLILENNLFLDSGVTLSGGGSIYANGKTIFLNGDAQVSGNSVLEFISNAVVDGQGHDLILGKYAQLLVDGGVTVTFKNMTIKNTLNTISCPPIRCMNWYSQACFDNVIFAFNDDWAFRNGQFFIYNDVEFTGTSKFSYRSVRPSYITSHSNLIFDPQTTFEFYPSTTDNKLIQMSDKTSTIIFDGSTLQTTHTGIQLTKGSLYFDNSVTLSSMDNTLIATTGAGFNIDSVYTTYSAAWSPDGKYLVFGNYNQASRLYSFNGSSFTYLSNVDLAYYTTSAAWSPDGKYLVLGNVNQVSRLYRFEGSAFTYLSNVDSAYATNSVAWSPDGKYLVLGNYGQVSRLYSFNGSSFTYLSNVDSAYNTYSVAWSPDGKYLVLGNDYEASRLYSFNGSSFTYLSNVDSAYATHSVAWSPDGKYLVLGNNTQVSRLYCFNRSSFTFLNNVDSSCTTFSVAWSPDGKYLVLGNTVNQASRLYRFEGSSFTWLGNIDSIYNTQSVAWSPDGKYLVVGVYSGTKVSKCYSVTYIFDSSTQGFVNGITFGNSITGASQDLDVYLLAAARIGIYGKVCQDSVNSSWNFQSRDSYISLDRYDSEFKITHAASMEDWKKNQIIKSSAPNTLFLQDNQVWGATSDNFAPEETFDLMSNLIIPDGQLTKFSANAVIDGQGYDLILGKYAQLLVDGGVTVTFKNMTIRNTLNTISCPPIRCMDWYSQACFDNVTFSFNDDWAFRNGQFFIQNDVNFTGTSKFSYRSVRPSYIASHSNLIFNPQTTFEYYPSTTDNSLIKMQDKTSTIIFDGSTLQTTHTGIRLTTGSLYFDNKVTLSSAGNMMLSAVGTGVSIASAYTVPAVWSPDGKYLVLGNYSQVSRLYRLEGSSFTYVCNVDETSYKTMSAAWSPDGKYLVLGNYNQVSRLYRFEGSSFTYLSDVDLAYNTQSAAWSPDGKYLVLGNYSQVSRLYRFEGSSFTYLSDVDLAYKTQSAVWSPDSKYLVLGNQNEVSRLYRFNGSSFTYLSDVDSAYDTYSVAWSPDGKYLILGNNGVSKLYRFEGSTFTYLSDVDSAYYTWSVAWSPDGKYLGLGNYGQVSKLYRFEGSSLTFLSNIDSAYDTQSVAWSPDGKYLVLGNYQNQSSKNYPISYTFDTSPQGYSNSIIFGNSALGQAYDADIYVLGGANVNIAGKVWYDDVN